MISSMLPTALVPNVDTESCLHLTSVIYFTLYINETSWDMFGHVQISLLSSVVVIAFP